MEPRPPTLPIVLAGLTAFLNLYATQPLLPLLARSFSASHFAVSLTVTMATVGVAIAAPAVGRLADLWGRQRVIVGSATILAAATGLAATATTLNQLIAWRFVQGLVTPGVFAVTIAYIHEEWPAARAGTGTAAYVSGTVVGGFIGRVVSGAIAADVSWRAAFVGLALMNAAAAAALWAWLPRERAGRAKSGRQPSGVLWRHLRNPQLQVTYAIGFCVLFSLVAMFTYVTFVLAAPPFQLSTTALGAMFVVYLVGAVITPPAGRWIDHYGHRSALAAATGVGIVGALLTLGHSLPVVLAGLALSSSGVFISQATASSYVGVAAGHDRGLAVGLYAMFYYAGGSAGGSVPSLFWTSGGWPACVALVIAVQVGMVTLAFLKWNKTGGPDFRTMGEPEA